MRLHPFLQRVIRNRSALPVDARPLFVLALRVDESVCAAIIGFVGSPPPPAGHKPFLQRLPRVNTLHGAIVLSECV